MIAAILPEAEAASSPLPAPSLSERVDALAREGRGLWSIYFAICRERPHDDPQALQEQVSYHYRRHALASLF